MYTYYYVAIYVALQLRNSRLEQHLRVPCMLHCTLYDDLQVAIQVANWKLLPASTKMTLSMVLGLTAGII